MTDFRFFFGNDFSEIGRQFSARYRRENEKGSYWKWSWKNPRWLKHKFLVMKMDTRRIPNLSWVQICKLNDPLSIRFPTVMRFIQRSWQFQSGRDIWKPGGYIIIILNFSRPVCVSLSEHSIIVKCIVVEWQPMG